MLGAPPPPTGGVSAERAADPAHGDAVCARASEPRRGEPHWAALGAAGLGFLAVFRSIVGAVFQAVRRAWARSLHFSPGDCRPASGQGMPPGPPLPAAPCALRAPTGAGPQPRWGAGSGAGDRAPGYSRGRHTGSPKVAWVEGTSRALLAPRARSAPPLSKTEEPPQEAKTIWAGAPRVPSPAELRLDAGEMAPEEPAGAVVSRESFRHPQDGDMSGPGGQLGELDPVPASEHIVTTGEAEHTPMREQREDTPHEGVGQAPPPQAQQAGGAGAASLEPGLDAAPTSAQKRTSGEESPPPSPGGRSGSQERPRAWSSGRTTATPWPPRSPSSSQRARSQ